MDARTYIDWIGPALVRHKMNDILRQDGSVGVKVPEAITADESVWKVTLNHAEKYTELADDSGSEDKMNLEKAIDEWTPIQHDESSETTEVEQRLSFQYAYQEAAQARAKQSVTEIKRQSELKDEYSDEQMIQQLQKPIYK